MYKQLVKNFLLWGFLLWLFGYLLGILLFMIVPPQLIGFFILPLGTAITLMVLFRKIKAQRGIYYLGLAIFWTLMATVLDYLFIVKAFQSTNYYKLDVYLYYALTFVLPLLAYFIKSSRQVSKGEV